MTARFNGFVLPKLNKLVTRARLRFSAPSQGVLLAVHGPLSPTLGRLKRMQRAGVHERRIRRLITVMASPTGAAIAQRVMGECRVPKSSTLHPAVEF